MSEGYKPTAGMKAAARKAIKFKEDGKANGAGTAVGWTRARQLVNGEALSLSTVKRMYSFFSRHEVDKKGKDWGNQSNPSNGYIMWLAWGGDAGFSWSRKIVNREKNMKKGIEAEEIVEEIKGILEDVINPITEVIEIEDDNINKSISVEIEEDKEDEEECDCENCKSNGIECKDCDECMSKSYDSDDEDDDKWDNMQKACWTGYRQVGMKTKNGRRVPNCVPIKKSIFGTDGPQTLIPKNK
jgi:hypothetical protein